MPPASPAIAKVGVRALLLLAPAELPRLNDVTIDPTVLWFAVAIAAFTGEPEPAHLNVAFSAKAGTVIPVDGGLRRYQF